MHYGGSRMRLTIPVLKENTRYEVYAEEGEILHRALCEFSLLAFPCGGTGKCGRCRIMVSGAISDPTPEECELLSEKEIADGMHLACYTKAVQGMEITVPHEDALSVLTSLSDRHYALHPVVEEKIFTVPQPTLEDQRSDLRRLLAATDCTHNALSLRRLADVAEFVHGTETVHAIVRGDTLINYSASSMFYAISIDIGTTSIAATISNLHTGEILLSHGEPSAQASFGADVISRIQYDMQWRSEQACKTKRDISPLRRAVVEQLNSIIDCFCQRFALEDVACISIAGNTVMLHLLCGLPTENIGRAPFTPVMLCEQCFSSQELGFHSDAPVYLLPGIASYVGADITAALLAAEAWKAQAPFLLLDIGTNAETVLGVNGKLFACSAAAGPCFEGVNLECGMTGRAGAICDVSRTADGDISFATIENAPAVGICGSGVVALIACLLDAGIVDETGALCDDDDTPLGKRVRDDKVYITDTVTFSQKDLREIQMAKAAVRAGIDILLQNAGLKEADIERVYLAGGFGSALSAEAAVRLGLFPEHLAQKTVVLGNAAATGALRYITEENALEHARALCEATRYVELSCDSAFTDAYVERMFFPEI